MNDFLVPMVVCMAATAWAGPTSTPGDDKGAVLLSLVEELEAFWTQSAASARWRSPGVIERRQFQNGLLWLLRAAQSCSVRLDDLQGFLNGSPFTVAKIESAGVWVIHERESDHDGGGLYAIRCGPEARPWVLQAPHSMFDRGTRQIVQRMFRRTHARAAFFNTVHRYRSHPKEQPSDAFHPADAAHQYGSFFQAATVAAAASETALRFIQIHGFREVDDIPFDAVLSSGTPNQPPNALAKALKGLWPRVGAFGIDVRKLGATTNVQGAVLNRKAVGRFVHIELNATSREALRRDDKTLTAFIEALEGPWW